MLGDILHIFNLIQ